MSDRQLIEIDVLAGVHPDGRPVLEKLRAFTLPEADRYQLAQSPLFATGAAFTVVAWGFAYVYAAAQAFSPGSFAGAEGAGEQTWFELLYLSFANLTSVGLSDVTAVLPHARAVVIIEQVAGVMYVALIIARVVGLTIHRWRS